MEQEEVKTREISDQTLGHVLHHVDLVDQIQGTMLTFHFSVVVAVVQDKSFKFIYNIYLNR